MVSEGDYGKSFPLMALGSVLLFPGVCVLCLAPGDLISGVCTSGTPLDLGDERGRILLSALPEVPASGMCLSWGWVPVPPVTP